MNETTVTVAGNVAQEPKMRVTSGGARVTSFRLAVTERRFNKPLNQWRDGDTIWYTVTVWRALAENVFDSVVKGQPVVVHGRLRVSTYDDKEGQQRTNVEIEATAVGHDLSRGTSRFTKMGSGVSVERQLAAELAAELDREAAGQFAGGVVQSRPLAAVGVDDAGGVDDADPGAADDGGGHHPGWNTDGSAQDGSAA